MSLCGPGVAFPGHLHVPPVILVTSQQGSAELRAPDTRRLAH